MSPTAPATTPSCPECGGGMKVRNGSRGSFLGCATYPRCTGTRSIGDAPSRPASAAPARTTAPPPSAPPPNEAPGPSAALIADLRKAAGHLGAAIDLLSRRGAEIDRLMDGHDGVTF